ncbi:MAG: hypothetical protein ACI9SQ_000087 [Rubritalea sp.]|jgi:hypothetical protein
MTTIFNNYDEWRIAITERCGLKLDHSYCEERLTALNDESIPATKAFITTYDLAYRDLVISWFTRALAEA